MKENLSLWFCLLIFPLLISAQPNTNTSSPTTFYQISFPNAIHHEAEISIDYKYLPNKPLIVTMSSSSLGRYAIHHFGKNVYNVRAFNEAGKALKINRIEPESWEVKNHKGTVKIQYTLFADRADGTYSEIDDTHAHLNIPATFMWAKSLEEYPITVQFEEPENSNWKVATQLKTTPNLFVFKAPNLQYFMDSPTKLSNYSLREWAVQNPDGKEHKIYYNADKKQNHRNYSVVSLTYCYSIGI